MTLDILCKVVDNYGDIGVVYRLAKALSELDPELGIRIHIDELRAFSALRPGIDPGAEVQALGPWGVFRWDLDPERLRGELLRGGAPRAAGPGGAGCLPTLVLECFACGRPPGLEELLFDPARAEERLVVNLEHLTAEAWADELHLMPSATRSAAVRKVIFMPGFTPATGGLIIDRGFREALARWRPELAGAPAGAASALDAAERARLRRDLAGRAGLALGQGGESRFWLTVFSYARNYDSAVGALADFGASVEGGLLALVAAGPSAEPFVSAWRRAGKPFDLLELPFLPQETWDEVLLASDFAIVRGEESLSRAALGGLPFLWHAYLQDEGHQLVKLRALLDRLRPALAAAGAPPGAVAAYEALSLAFNDRERDGPETVGEEDFRPLLSSLAALEPGFRSFAAALLAQGDLAARLLVWLRAQAPGEPRRPT